MDNVFGLDFKLFYKSLFSLKNYQLFIAKLSITILLFKKFNRFC